MRRAAAFALVILFALMAPLTVEAAKPRVRKSTAAKSAGVAYSSAKLSRPTNNIKLTFLNLDRVNKVDYLLNYTANGKQEGAGGRVTPGGQATDSRALYFGTCSKGVCTPHTSIKNATLLVTTTLKSGATHVKRYRIKI